MYVPKLICSTQKCQMYALMCARDDRLIVLEYDKKNTTFQIASCLKVFLLNKFA